VDVDSLPGCPPELRAALAEHTAEVVRVTDHSPRFHVRLSSPSGPLFGWYSSHPDDEVALAHELAVRAAVDAGGGGVLRSPPVLAHGRNWRLERMIEPEPIGPSLPLVLEAWRRLTALDLPRRASPRVVASPPERLRRWAALARSPLPVADLVRARRMTADVPTVTVHGDFHRVHVLPRDSAVWVIDWEVSGRGQRGLDLMQLWASLPEAADRDALLAAALGDVGPEVLKLRYVALVRRIASKLAEFRRFGDPDRAEAEALLALLPEARRAVT
jgi:hypothetical protein